MSPATEVEEALRVLNRARLRRVGGSGGGRFLREAAELLEISPAGSVEALQEAVDRFLDRPSRRLAVYGSLAPGEVNAGVLAPLSGTWRRGSVRGTLRRRGWGAAHGFPGLEWDPEGEPVSVRLFVSPELPGHWPRLDAFEGDDYLRSLVPVRLGSPHTDGEGTVVANAYLVRPGTAAG